jgi:hypothetical protein
VGFSFAEFPFYFLSNVRSFDVNSTNCFLT